LTRLVARLRWESGYMGERETSHCWDFHPTSNSS